MFVHIYRTEISFKACRSPVSRILSQFFFLIVRRFENISYTKRPRASLFRQKNNISSKFDGFSREVFFQYLHTDVDPRLYWFLAFAMAFEKL